ncbi:hypothetical protein N7486_006579 [Penicillium sp. IBT 16267x]|nr:hypothetical protein N7486_006579 [Penicillium sp. IBT 16267x]
MPSSRDDRGTARTYIGKGIWPKHDTPDTKYPENEAASDVHIRRLGGWGSGSKIQKAHFLTTRIFWKHEPLKDLVEESSGELRSFSSEIRKSAMDCCEGFLQFNEYCADIRKYSGTKPKPWGCEMLVLGPFAGIRSMQFQIRRDLDVVMGGLEDTPAGNTRSHTGYAEAPQMMLDHGDSSQHSTTRSGTEESGNSGGFTAHIKEFSAESAVVPETSVQLNNEKLIESTFISLLHTLCLKIGDLKVQWEHRSPTSRVSLIAAHDGQLQGPDPRRQPEAIVW